MPSYRQPSPTNEINWFYFFFSSLTSNPSTGAKLTSVSTAWSAKRSSATPPRPLTTWQPITKSTTASTKTEATAARTKSAMKNFQSSTDWSLIWNPCTGASGLGSAASATSSSSTTSSFKCTSSSTQTELRSSAPSAKTFFRTQDPFENTWRRRTCPEGNKSTTLV